ncbi:MAG: phosphoesterase, partial [Lysobacteraceae bacterium]
MGESIEVRLGGEPVRLLADRALYWPARRRLLLADLHLGKADTFRAAGIALPRGGTALDLARIAALVAAQGAEELWVLGDLLHGRTDLSSWRAAWEA